MKPNIASITILTDDVPRLVRFYQDVLGFTVQAAGVKPHQVHIPSELIAAYDNEWGDSLLGDKTHSMIFDNPKIKRLVPDFKGVVPYTQVNRMIHAYRSAWPQPDQG